MTAKEELLKYLLQSLAIQENTLYFAQLEEDLKLVEISKENIIYLKKQYERVMND